MSKQYKIMVKLACLLGGCVALILFLMGINLYHMRESMLTERRMTLKSIVETSHKIIVHNYHEARAGKIDMAEAKKRSRNTLNSMRYGDGGYIFVVTTEGLMLVHANITYAEPTFDLIDINGIYLIREFIRSVLYGDGYTIYHFQKPGETSGITQKKMSYGMYFQPWDWVIGTGIYIDDIEEAFIAQIYKWLKFMTLPFLLLLIGTYYLGKTISKPILLLEEAKNSAETATRAKSDFLANMSHEIRTPLNGVMGMLSLILGTKLNSQQKEWTKVAHNSAEELLNLINDILDLSKVEAEHMVLEETSFDLQTNVKAVTDLLYQRASHKNVELMVAFQTDLPRMVVGDPVRLRQILLNLVGNAIKFTEEGSVLISVEGREDNSDLLLEFEIKDTGIGIPLDKQTYIFEKFSQAEETTTRNFGGTGLGLAICCKLTELMGGKIGVRSVLKEGSTFWFNIRLKQDLQGEPTSHKISNGREVRVLVGNRNRTLCGLMRDYLLSWGCHYDDLASGLDFYDMLQQGVALGAPYHFATIDVDILSGDCKTMETYIESIRSISPQTRLIILSKPEQAFSDEDLILKQHVALLTKPLFPQDFWDIMMLLDSYEQTAVRPSVVTVQDSCERRLNLNGVDELCSDDKAGKKHILLVEDQVVNQMLMRAFFTQIGCDVTLAANGREAVQFVVKQKFDLVFMDCHMPEMDGFEATKQIRAFEEKLDRHVPIVALTADAMQGDRDKCISEGMDDYLQKPVKIETIKAIINKYIPNSPEVL